MGQRWGHDHCPTRVRPTSDEPLVIIASSGPVSLLHASEIPAWSVASCPSPLHHGYQQYLNLPMGGPQKPPAFANVPSLLQITREGGNEFPLFTSLKNSSLFRHNYLATSKKGTIDCRAELAFCCIGSDSRLHRYKSTS